MAHQRNQGASKAIVKEGLNGRLRFIGAKNIYGNNSSHRYYHVLRHNNVKGDSE